MWFSFPPSYLLVLGVLGPEVAAHNLEVDVKMWQSVQQVHPPRRGIIHHGRHPGPAAWLLAVASLTRTHKTPQVLRRESAEKRHQRHQRVRKLCQEPLCAASRRRRGDDEDDGRAGEQNWRRPFHRRKLKPPSLDSVK